MSARVYPNGTGGVLGDELIIETELYTTGLIYYVHHTGSDSNNGLSRQKPFATLHKGNSVLATNDILVLMDGHTETISARVDLTVAGVRIVGEGSNGGVPTVTLTSTLNDVSTIRLTQTNQTIANIKFAVGGSIATVGRVHVTAVRAMIRGCYFECGSGDQFGVLYLSDTATGARVYSSTFVNVSTTTQPKAGVITNDPTDTEFEACTFDGGSTNFSLGGFWSDQDLVRMRAQQTRLLNGAGFIIGDATIGYLGVAENTGSPTVEGFHTRLAGGFKQLGDALLSDPELYMSGVPYYVSYATGNDANSGLDEQAPMKTLGNTLAITSPGDIVVLLPGHVEPVSGAILGSNSVTIVGCGTANGKPTCRLYDASGGGSFVVFTTNLVVAVRNVWFDGTVGSDTQTSIVLVNSDYSELRGCLITPGLKDTHGVEVNNNFVTIRECKFDSPGTSVSSRAHSGLHIFSEGAVLDLDIRGTEFSNSAFGFSTAALFSESSVTRMYGISNTLSFGADAQFPANSTGMFNPETASGSAKVTW